MPGADPIVTVIGPLSTSLAGIKIFMSTVISAKPWLWEPALVPLPWNTSFRIFPGHSLKIGVLWDDNVVKPHPPITRALQSVVSKLQAIPNVSLVDWKPHLHDEAWAIISSLCFTDGGDEDAAAMAASGEPWRPLTKWIIKENPCVNRLSMQELWYWQEEREAYRAEYARLWNDTATGQNGETGELEGIVDVILCPVGPGVAPRHNTAKYWGYTSQWNLLDYPALVFPVSRVEAKIDKVEKDYKPMNDVDRDNWDLCEL
jgi:amidase